MNVHFFFSTDGYVILPQAGTALFREAVLKLRHTDTIKPDQLIEDSWLSVAEAMPETVLFNPMPLREFMHQHNGHYCLMKSIPYFEYAATLQQAANYVEIVRLLNAGNTYEEALKEGFKSSVGETGTLFSGSLEAGRLSCLCSRCGQRIYTGSAVIRTYPENESGEYRYHAACLGMTDPGPAESLMGYTCLKCEHMQPQQGDCSNSQNE